MESDIIKISHLNKSFGEVKAVNDLSFRVKKGELFAFLGVNGAGKSTTISILCGLLKKDSGTVQVNGIETDKAGAQTKRMLHQHMVHASICRLKDDKLVFYSSENDSIIFYRKN